MALLSFTSDDGLVLVTNYFGKNSISKVLVNVKLEICYAIVGG